jgi:hypothetical protein
MLRAEIELITKFLESYGIPLWPELYKYMEGVYEPAASVSKALDARSKLSLIGQGVSSIATPYVNTMLSIATYSIETVYNYVNVIQDSLTANCTQWIFNNTVLGSYISADAIGVLFGWALAAVVATVASYLTTKYVYPWFLSQSKKALRASKNILIEWFTNQEKKEKIRKKMRTYLNILNTAKFGQEYLLDVSLTDATSPTIESEEGTSSGEDYGSGV